MAISFFASVHVVVFYCLQHSCNRSYRCSIVGNQFRIKRVGLSPTLQSDVIGPCTFHDADNMDIMVKDGRSVSLLCDQGVVVTMALKVYFLT